MQTMYIGDSRRDLNLKKNRVYTDRPLELIKSVEQKYSLIGKLFIAIDDLNEHYDKLHEAGSVENTALKQLRSEN